MLPYPRLVAHLVEYLEVALHLVLFIRGLYPPHLFTDAQKYGAKVKVCRSPLVVHYIRSVLASLEPDFHRGLIDNLALLVLDGDRVTDRLVFQIDWPTRAGGVPEEVRRGKGRELVAPVDEQTLFAQFKGALVSMHVVDSSLPRPPPNATFTITMDLANDVLADPKRDTNRVARSDQWVPADSDVPDVDAVKHTHGFSFHPVRTIDTHLVRVVVFTERFPDRAVTPPMPMD
ncbi:MAD2 mitotic arrest deficient-like 2 [Allomyces arbusculus]|nr:MAD2 mitotic arrest deficient-like 2 [Allomyces arbusculus]